MKKKTKQIKIERIIIEIWKNSQWICVGKWRIKHNCATVEQIAKEICPTERRVAEASLDLQGTALIRLF